MSIERDSALERLFETEGKRLWRALVAYSGNRDIASDAVAEAFAQALARGGALDSPERWVWRAAFRIAAGELKARGRNRMIVQDPSYDMLDSPRDLIAALVKLSPKQRGALVLHFYAGYSTPEVAGMLGSSPATIRVHRRPGRRPGST